MFLIERNLTRNRENNFALECPCSLFESIHIEEMREHCMTHPTDLQGVVDGMPSTTPVGHPLFLIDQYGKSHIVFVIKNVLNIIIVTR